MKKKMKMEIFETHAFICQQDVVACLQGQFIVWMVYINFSST